MSLGACIPELLAQGKIRKADADKADRTYKRHYEALKGTMGDEAAAAEATARALDELDYSAKLKKRQAGLAIVAQQGMDRAQDAAVAKGINPHRWLTRGLLRPIADLKEVIDNNAHEMLYQFLQRHRRNLIGRPKDRTGLIDVVRELHGQDTGNAMAKVLAKAIHDTFERLRLRFNRAGGDIALRSDFGLPHRHDPLKIRQAGFARWKAFIQPLLNLAKMIDPLSGGAFTPERLDEFLEASFKNITTNGLSELGGSGGLASRALANRRSDPRFFVFKDGDAWLKYAGEFSDGNPFEAIMSHVHGMARDIAFMEKMGPNPAASWARAVDRSDRIAANSAVTHTGVINGTSAGKYRAEQTWRYMNGDLTVPVLAEGDGLVPKIQRGTVNSIHAARDLLTSALLGSAQLTSILDINTNRAARGYNAIPTSAALGYLKQLNPLDASDRKLAVYLGAGMKDAARSMTGLARWFGENAGPRWSQVLADGVLRVTGMNKFFEAGRASFITDYFRQLGRERGLTYEQLPEMRRAAFDRHGIAPEDWDTIRSADVHRFGGVDRVDWHKVAEADPKVADTLVAGILREARSAVLESDPETQGLIRLGRPGTLGGELSGTVFQFKSFPVALIMSQAERIAEINARQGAAAAAKYVGSFVVGMWLLGAVSLQAKEVSKGRDLRPMDTPDFWFDAFVNGGALGPIGDLVGSLKHDTVNGLGQYIGGPFVSLIEDSAHLATSAFKQDAQTGERGTDFGNQTQRFLRRYTPGTTIWYARAALDRMLWDEVQERIDPNYAEHQQRMTDVARRRGQDWWWQPGHGSPDRSPAMSSGPAE